MLKKFIFGEFDQFKLTLQLECELFPANNLLIIYTSFDRKTLVYLLNITLGRKV